ncbi:MAG: DivIVA domain-containing protein [Acidimicrobiia bacterium]|nr:DivIVA domain-containing protein [Acidimicrobiia bacterium]
MKVRSEDLSKVRFPEGRRGYDADKVDAVLSEIIETLREYEAADEALHRTFVEAQRIKDEMVAEASVEADQVRAESEKVKAAGQIEAEKIIAAAAEDANKKRASTEENVAKAKSEIDRRLAEAEERAAEKLKAAERDAASVRTEAAKQVDTVKIEAEAEAKSKLSAAKKEANDMLTVARAEHAELSKKVPQLRTAVSDIRARLIELAESTQNELGVVDGMIDLASNEAIPTIAQGQTKSDAKAVEAKEEAAPAEEAPVKAAAAPAEEAPVKAEEAPPTEAPKNEPKAEESPAKKIFTAPPEEAAAKPAGDLADQMTENADGSVFDTSSLKSLASDLDDAVPGDESKETFYGSGLRRRLTEGTKSKKGR